MTRKRVRKSLRTSVSKEYPLTMQDVADILECHYNTARKKVLDGKIAHFWSNGQYRFKRKWVDDFIKRNTWHPKHPRRAR